MTDSSDPQPVPPNVDVADALGLPGPGVSLPAPTRERWQPLRSGVLNLYRYDNEEFHYADGRLLLRGNNGSGKSRVLALQLPFLLDGEVSPARVEPDGDSAKRIEWNLLMGRHHDRTGYTWIEFGRRAADGAEHFITLGCGLRAVEGTSGLQSRWFFVTSRRIGRDLVLQSEQRVPLTRDRLAERLGSEGRVFLKAEDYRRAVDDALFGLGARYGALIDLLLRLRRPQLTRKLDENELPEALSDALPTLPGGIIDEVAESFRGLQADKDSLRAFNVAFDAVGAFLREYAGYVRIAVRRRAAAVRTANSGYEHAQRTAKDAQVRLDAATAALAILETEAQELDVSLASAEADERTLAASPEMKTAGELQLAEEAATTAAGALAIARTDETTAAHALSLAESGLRQAEEDAAALLESARSALAASASAAQSANLDELHRQQCPASDAADLTDLPFNPGAEAALGQRLTRQFQAVTLLRAGQSRITALANALQVAEQALRTAESAVSAARANEHGARDALATAAEAHAVAYAAWQSTTRHLRADEPGALADAFADWLARREGPGPFRLAVTRARDAADQDFATRSAGLTQALAENDAQRTQLAAEIARLENGEASPPPPPPTRRAARTARPGAPLWQLCDFRPDLPPSAHAGLEAALQASGLLDAWLLPDGRLLAPDDDTYLFVNEAESDGGPPQSRLTTSLGDVLVPAIDAEATGARQISAETVAQVLRHIGAAPGQGVHWVSTDGSWRLGPLTGRWSKAEAEFLGEGTRAAARRRQLAELQVRAAGLSALANRLRGDRATLDEARAEAIREASAAPDEEPLRRAGYELETAARLHSERILAADQAARVTEEHRGEHTAAVAKVRADAVDLGLAAWLDRLDDYSAALNSYAQSLASLWPTLRHATSLVVRLTQARERQAAAEAEHRTRGTRREQADAHAAATRQRSETLRATHGQSIAEVLARFGAAQALVQETKGRMKTNAAGRLARTAERSSAESELAAAHERRAEKEAERRTAITHLRALAEQRLLIEAAPSVDAGLIDHDLSAARAVELARALESALADVPATSEQWTARQDQIHAHIQELRDRLIPHGHQPETHQLDDIVLVRCLFQARPHTMTELHAAFGSEIEQRGRLLQEREREIIENHLLAEAAVELQKLIRAAEAWRSNANAEMHQRPTSTGVRFRFQWEADTEIRFHEVRPILLRKGELWTPAERAAVSGFLQARITAEQAADESGSWRDHLARALDYRRWHRFVIERQQEGQWRRLNKATYGTGSGGEKALALTLPRFAAAAAHYTGASPLAPRLVMLDEAFAGIDPTMRAQCLGVLAQFDLDVVMTSELEWGCYATVPALAIYHLTTLPGIDAVASTRWLWNGREKRRAEPSAT